MIPSKVRAGTSFTAYMDFWDNRNRPLVVTSPVEYSIRDSERNLVVSGVTQQGQQAQRWQTDITLPDSVPPGHFIFTWTAKTKEGKESHVEHFDVVDPAPNYYELDQLLPERSYLTDSLKLDRDEVISSANIIVLTPEGIPILNESVDVSNPIYSGSKQYINFRSAGPVYNLLAGDSVFAMYIINWSFVLDGEMQNEYHFVYVVNHKTLMYVNELKRMIDKAAIQHPNPNLRYNDVDLVAYLNMGLQWLNAQLPTQTNWTITTVPNTAYSYLLAAAAYEALSSRFLAEGEAAFNFNGQPITFEVDRTGFIESAIGRYKDRMDEFPNVKRSIIMSSGGGIGSASSGGVLLYSVGPTLQFSPYGQNSRSPMYQAWISENTGYTQPVQ